MARITIALGVVLILLGAGGYVGSGMASWTALIPAILGVPFVVLGAIALNPKRRKMAMHIALVFGVIGTAGTFRGLMKLPALITDPESIERKTAVGVQAVVCLLCLAFLALGIWSFVAARRATK